MLPVVQAETLLGAALDGAVFVVATTCARSRLFPPAKAT